MHKLIMSMHHPQKKLLVNLQKNLYPKKDVAIVVSVHKKHGQAPLIKG